MHCCTCTRVCHHTSPPTFCDKHGGNINQPWPPSPLPKTPSDWPSVSPIGVFPITLTDADIDRIARRVVEIMKQQGLVATEVDSADPEL
jgi:hypothetical protein